MIALHKEIRAKIAGDMVVVGGPYWCLNLALWVRGLITYPCVSLGSTYRYHMSGGPFPGRPVTRVAIGPLRRWARANKALKVWLEDTLKVLPAGEPSRAEFQRLHSKWLTLTSAAEAARMQVAEYYRTWLDELEAIPAPGRALGLYQMLSQAYVLGKNLKKGTDPLLLPKGDQDSARKPHLVAEQHMLNCLG
jgi:hypothetical protein